MKTHLYNTTNWNFVHADEDNFSIKKWVGHFILHPVCTIFARKYVEYGRI